MFPALKKAFLPAVLVALLLGAASQVPTTPASANIGGTTVNDGVWFLDSYTPASADECDEGDPREIRLFGTGDVSHIDESDGILLDDGLQDPVVQIGVDDELIMCVMPANTPNDEAPVVFNASGGGTWDDAHCGSLAITSLCLAEQGAATGSLTVINTTVNPPVDNDLDMIAVTFTCNSAGVQTITINQDDNDDEIVFLIMCKGDAANLSVTVSPDRVESSPALGNASLSLIRAEITDASGGPIRPDSEVTITTSNCSLSGIASAGDREEAITLFKNFSDNPRDFFDDVDEFATRFSPEGKQISVPTIEVDTNDPPDGLPNHSEALALLHAEGCDPGPVTITVRVLGLTTRVQTTATITIVGPPAFITITASPTKLICGEKSEITVSATDKLKQQLSDNTYIELVTNYGGILGGTGSSLTYGGPVDPVSNTTVSLLKGTGKAYLLTSDTHVGPYEVLAASTLSIFGHNLEDHPPVTAQVTVTCTKGTPTPVTAPNTGTGASTGSIRPPNTGDAGLAAPSSTNATLYVIAAAIAFVMAGLATISYARR
jgi:hypothetical protein